MTNWIFLASRTVFEPVLSFLSKFVTCTIIFSKTWACHGFCQKVSVTLTVNFAVTVTIPVNVKVSVTFAVTVKVSVTSGFDCQL